MFLDNSWMCYFRVCLLVYQLGQRNKKYQRYVYLFCSCTEEKVEEIETFTLIKEKGILWDRGNLFWRAEIEWEVSEKREKLKGNNTCWMWRKNMTIFFSTNVMFCFTTNDNDGNMESEWKLALNEDKSTSYNKREINWELKLIENKHILSQQCYQQASPNWIAFSACYKNLSLVKLEKFKFCEQS